MTVSAVARGCGWERDAAPCMVPRGYGRQPDDSRVRALLGLKENTHVRQDGHRTRSRQQSISIKDAEQIMRAIGADPHEVGL